MIVWKFGYLKVKDMRMRAWILDFWQVVVCLLNDDTFCNLVFMLIPTYKITIFLYFYIPIFIKKKWSTIFHNFLFTKMWVEGFYTSLIFSKHQTFNMSLPTSNAWPNLHSTSLIKALAQVHVVRIRALFPFDCYQFAQCILNIWLNF